MIYSFSSHNRGSKFLDIEFTIENNKEEEIFVQLPSWRPGRYELANFAKNIQKFEVKTINNKPLPFEKVTKDKWKIKTGNVKKLKIIYNYYANELNAGSTWIDEEQVYVNPVNCCLFVEGRENEPIRLFFNQLNHSKCACSLQKIGEHYVAESFDELADSPFILSDNIQHNSYEVQGVKFNLWFQGECRPPWKKIIKDFKAFTKEQLKVFKSFPFEEYHFLYQILPFQAYHGVEHLKSTVISFGPGFSVFDGDDYEEFLGVSSHELFHAWNVKSIRPADMVPYDFTKENYTRMGYLTEGVTTYYGDLMLYRSKVFSQEQFLKQINKSLDRHSFNYGIENLSVSESSFDTWLDGYSRGIPNRKGSIYTEGSILALITDLLIRNNSKGKFSLDTILKDFYDKKAKKGKGISEDYFKQKVNEFLGKDEHNLIEAYYYQPKNLIKLLNAAIKPFGGKISKTTNGKHLAAFYGIYTSPNSCDILFIAPNSPGEKLGLNPGDSILAINQIEVKGNNVNNWAKYFGKHFELTYKKDGFIKSAEIVASSKTFFPKVRLDLPQDSSSKLLKNWQN